MTDVLEKKPPPSIVVSVPSQFDCTITTMSNTVTEIGPELARSNEQVADKRYAAPVRALTWGIGVMVALQLATIITLAALGLNYIDDTKGRVATMGAALAATAYVTWPLRQMIRKLFDRLTNVD